MRRRLRWLLAALCVAGVAALLLFGRFGPADAERSAVGESTGAACRQCHAAVWDEWTNSRHAQTWTSPQVQAAFQHFGHDRKCESCHAPEPILFTAADVPPRLRAADRESGVDCLACHGLSGGQVAAARTIADAPCRPVATPELFTSEHCGRCHVAIHKDWLASRYPAENKTCQSCHLPAVAGRPAGRSHLCLGGHDESLVRSGVRLDCRREAEELVVEVTNHATGHNFPGERHNRVLLLQVIERSSDGDITLIQQRTIKDITPFRGESSAEQIRAGETFTARFPVVSPPVVAEVQLLYKHFPWHRDDQALVVHAAKVELK